MSQGKINEEIVLESYNGFKSYSMVIDTDGLTPVKTETGRVNLTDENGETVVTIAAPYMYDSAEKHSYDVDVTVTQESKKEWRITYTPDSEWLTDKDRVYPVVIDPTVTTSNVTYTDIIDAYVHTGQTSSSNFNDHYLEFGYQNNTEYISFIRLLSLPSLPSGALLTGAGLVMKFTEDTEFHQNIGLYSVSGNIYNGNLTWSNKPSITDFLDNQGSIPESLWITFCSKSFGSRINNAYKNGVSTLTYAIKFTSKVQGVTEFYSADATNVSDRPYFTFRYTTEFYNVPEGKYYIRNVKSGLYLNVRNDATTSGSEVTQKGYSGELPQIWKIRKAGTDSYYIIPQNATNLKLYAPDSGSVTVSSTDYIRNQWRFSRVQGATFNISTVNQPWVVLDVDGQSMKEDAIIYPFAYHGYTNQQWELIPAEIIEFSLGVEYADTISLDALGVSEYIEYLEFDSPFYGSLSWSSENESIASVDRNTGTITGRSVGEVNILGKCKGIHTVVVLHICVGYPLEFNRLMNQLDVENVDVQRTEDGLFYLKKSIAYLLKYNGVSYLLDGEKELPVDKYFDDWYIYSCAIDNDEFVYSLYCMREEEEDYDPDKNEVPDGDGDAPCVKISLVEFDMEALFDCMVERTEYCRQFLYDAISYTVQMNRADGVKYNTVLQSYFSDTNSEGAYYMAKEYVDFIAKIHNDGVVEAPSEFLDLLSPSNIENPRAIRVIEALKSINLEAGYQIFNLEERQLNLTSISNLNIYEQKAILTMFCANADYFSFAAEVQFHAQGFYDLETLLDRYYNSCLRACMSVDDVLKKEDWEEAVGSFYEEYWDLNSEIVSAQREKHQSLVNQFA